MASTANPTSLSPMQRLFRLVNMHRKAANAILIYAIFISLINLSLPLGIQAIIGLLAGGSIRASWFLLILVVVLGVSLTGVLRYLQLSATEYLQRVLMRDASLEFAIRIPHLNLEKLRQEHLPELINRFFDTLTIQKGLPKILIDGSTALLQIVFSLLLVSFYHPTFLSFSVAIVLLLALLFRLTFAPGLETSLKESKYKYKIAYWLEEVGRVSATFKLAGGHALSVRETDHLVNEYLRARRKHFRVLVVQFMGSLTLRVLTVGSFLVIGSLLVMEGRLNIGQFVAAEILILFVVEYLEKVVLLMETLYDVLTASEKIGQFADLPLDPRAGVTFNELCPEKKMSIEWRNLSYRFPDADVPVLKNLTAQIAAGEKIAIAGYNGSGKSTLMQLNSGLLRNYTGTLLFNGLPFQNLDLDSLRANIGDVSSQEDIFKGTLLENISTGRDIPLARVVEVLEMVGLTEFVQQRPEGVNSILLPGAKGIPGSIVTKIRIARAIVDDPALLVLENPLQDLAPHDREHITRLITDPRRTWTMLCVTDDPMLAALCDRVFVLKNGELVQTGPLADIRRSEHFEQLF